MTGPIQLEDVKRLVVKPGETLLVTLPVSFRSEALQGVAESFREHLPDVNLVVVAGGVKVEVVAQEDV